ncbi:hypothetical protein ACTFIU_005362 [Dictyostelium citrinum]
MVVQRLLETQSHITLIGAISADAYSFAPLIVVQEGYLALNESDVEPGKEKKTLLLADNHSSNLQSTVSELAKKHNIEILTFPSNLTLLFQLMVKFKKNQISQTIGLILESAYPVSTCKLDLLSAWEAIGIDWESIKQHRDADKD